MDLLLFHDFIDIHDFICSLLVRKILYNLGFEDEFPQAATINSFAKIEEKLKEKVEVESPKYFNKFRGLQTNLQRINYVSVKLKRYKLFAAFRKDAKNDPQALEMQKKGDMMCANKQYTAAFNFYTTSIALAETSITLAICYAKRADLLAKNGLFLESLVDIKRALNNDYPEALRNKLLRKRTNYLKRVPRVSERSHEKKPFIRKGCQNPRIQSAFNCVKIKKNDNLGRQIVAAKNIKVGEVLAVEKPFVSNLVMEQKLSHCSECTEISYNLLPCPNCTQVMYCTEKCRQSAFSYHQYECPIALSIDELDTSQSKFLPLKLLFSIRNELENFSEDNLLPAEEKYQSDRYKEVHNLQRHANKWSTEYLFSASIFTALIFEMVKEHTTYFEGLEGKEDLFKELFFSHLQTVEINSKVIKEVTKYCNVFSDWETVGFGLYPFVSLFNHSCQPNAVCINYGSSVVVRAIRTIKENEQCFICYDMEYSETPKEIRKFRLNMNYFFNCQCRACSNNWSTEFSLNDVELPKKSISMDWWISCYNRMEKGDLATAKNDFVKLMVELRIVEKFEPCQSLCFIHHTVKMCFNLLGNKKLHFW